MLTLSSSFVLLLASSSHLRELDGAHSQPTVGRTKSVSNSGWRKEILDIGSEWERDMRRLTCVGLRNDWAFSLCWRTAETFSPPHTTFFPLSLERFDLERGPKNHPFSGQHSKQSLNRPWKRYRSSSSSTWLIALTWLSVPLAHRLIMQIIAPIWEACDYSIRPDLLWQIRSQTLFPPFRSHGNQICWRRRGFPSEGS